MDASVSLGSGILGDKTGMERGKTRFEDLRARIISRFTSSSSEYVEKRLMSIFGGSISDSMSIEYLKKKYMSGPKRKFETIIRRKFYAYWEAHQVSAEKEKDLLLKKYHSNQ